MSQKCLCPCGDCTCLACSNSNHDMHEVPDDVEMEKADDSGEFHSCLRSRVTEFANQRWATKAPAASPSAFDIDALYDCVARELRAAYRGKEKAPTDVLRTLLEAARVELEHRKSLVDNTWKCVDCLRCRIERELR